MIYTVSFHPSGRGKAQCPPNPDYPNGIIVDPGYPGTFVDLPYPAPECGLWIIHCNICSQNYGCTAAGRPDDPIKMRVPCKHDQ